MVVLLKLNRDKYIDNIQDKNQIINIRRLLDKIEIVLSKHTAQSTDFLDPYERRIAISILNQFDELSYSELGGIKTAERKTIVIYPHYYNLDDCDITIKSLMIHGYISKFTHRDFLGSILSLGINREKIGDILIHENYAQIVVKKEISDFILITLNKIGRENVRIKEIPINSLKAMDIQYKELTTTVSSLRLDAVISSSLNLSRNDSQKLIDSGSVKLNWEPIEKIHREVEEGDIVSIRGYGRFIVNLILGRSRKGRVRINIRLLK